MSLTPRQHLVRVCRVAYERHLTNAAGGNFSIKLEDGTFLSTKTKNTKSTLMEMSPEDLVIVDLGGTLLEGSGQVTSSWPTHSAVYREFPSVRAVIHAHPRYATVIAAAQRPMEPYLDVMDKFGAIPVLGGENKVDTPAFAAEVARVLALRRESVDRFGHAVLYPRHGVLVAAPSLDDAFDLLERIESNAVALLFARLLRD